MNKIAAASNLFSALNPSMLIKKKVASLVTEVVASGVKALNTKESVAPKDRVDRIDKHVDDQAGRFERIFAAHTRAHAVNEMADYIISKKDTNGDGVLNVGELGVPKDIFDKIDKNGDEQVGRVELNIAAHARAAINKINNMVSDILPDEESSKLDTTV